MSDAAAAPREGSSVLRLLPLVVGVLVLLVALASAWRYRAASLAWDDLLDGATAALADGNYASRVAASAALEAPEVPDGPLARLGNALIEAVGRDGLDARARARKALLARVEVERVALFGDRARDEAARAALLEARNQAPRLLDTVVASTLMALDDGHPDQAQTELATLDEAQRTTADAAWLEALVALAAGHRNDANRAAREATQLDERHLFARDLLIELRANRGDYTGALEDYDTLVGGIGRDHVDAHIDRARLQIRVNKTAEDAVDRLRALLEGRGQALAPAQRARIHDSIGRYYARRDDLASARSAYEAAMKAAPGDARYSTGLARLDMRAYQLDSAEAVLREAHAAEPGAVQHVVQLARVRLLRGDAPGALEWLRKVEKPDVEALLLKGQAHLELGDRRTAEETLTEALHQDGGLLDVRILHTLANYLQGRRPTSTLADLRARREAKPKDNERLEDPALPFRAFAQALEHKGDDKGAAAEYAAALVVEPRDFRAHFALCALAARDLQAEDPARRALKHCRAALDINPHHLPAARLASFVSEMYDDAGAVVAALFPVLARRSEPADLARRAARAYVALGQIENAEKLIAPDREPPDAASTGYVQGLVAAAKGELERAQPLLYAAADALTDDPWVQLSHADLLLRMDRAREAGTYYRRAMSAGDELSRAQRFGAFPRGALGAARADLEVREWSRAREAARIAEERARDSLSHPRVRAEALALQGQAWLASGSRRGRRNAESLLRRALKLETDLPAALMGLGMLAKVERRTEDAIERFRRVTRVAPDDPEGHFRLGELLRADDATAAAGREALEKAAKLDPQGQWGVRARRALQGRSP